MEKYGVNISEERRELLQKEARVMEQLTKLVSPIPGVKTAQQVHEERTSLESDLQRIRNDLNELDKYEGKSI